MEKQITDGRINIKGNMAVREKPKRADYVLYYKGNYPLAIVEAKDNNRLPSFGLQQAKEYALMMDIKFAYSSNGDSFAEFDFLTGKERSLALEDFPSEEELMDRLTREGKLTAEEVKIINQPFYTGKNAPRYYQQVAVDRTLDAIAKGQKRLLLVMATGTGKTYTAFQIVYRLLKAKLKKKILYLADRNILVDQSILQDFSPLAKVIHKVEFSHDNPTQISAYKVYFALYQQMVESDDVPHFQELFAPDFFDLIIVDECHRGSAKEESRWRRVLEYFSSATQIGMTATPKETKYVSNTDYFGEPVYTYSLNQGINDGFLAPFRVIEPRMNVSDGWRPLKGQRDYFGQEIPDRIYDCTDYDYNIVLEDRIREEAGKTSFTIMDFRGVTRLFADPAWDGPIERIPGFTPGKGVKEDPAPYGQEPPADPGDQPDPKEPRTVPFVRSDGCKVFTTTKTISIYDTDGKLLRQENIVDYTKENVRGQYGDLSKFIRTWSEADKKEAIAEALTQQGIDLDKLKHDMQLDDVDDHAGEFYTPRAVTDFMAKMIEPKLGETMADKRQAYLIQANGKEKSPKALDIRGFGELLILDAYPVNGRFRGNRSNFAYEVLSTGANEKAIV